MLAYLDRTNPGVAPGRPAADTGHLIHAAIDSPIHDRIKEVSAEEAVAGPAYVAALCADVAARTRVRFADERAIGCSPRWAGACSRSTTSAAPG